MTNRIPHRDRLIATAEQAFAERRFVRIGAPRGSGGDELAQQILAHAGEDGSLTLMENIETLELTAARERVAKARALAAKGRKVILTSSLPLTPLFADARIAGEMTEVGLEALALDEEEARHFLGADLEGCFSSAEYHGLLQRTEGWLGAWQLIRLLLQEGGAPGELARRFDGRNRDLVAFFDHQILPHMADDSTDLLLATAPLDRLSPTMCDMATDRSDSDAVLESAAAQCGFVMPVGNAQGEWRVHAMFRDYLRQRSRRSDEGHYQAVARKAASFALSRNDWLGAAKLYEEAGLTDLSVDVLREHGDELLTGRGEIAGFRQAVANLPLAADGAQPLALEMALSSLFSGNVAGSAALAEQAATRLGDEPIGEVHSRIAAIRICVSFGQEHFAQVREAARIWLAAGEQVDPQYRALVALAACSSCHALLDERGFVAMLAEARRALATATSAFLSTWCDLIDVMHGLRRGDLGKATERVEHAASTGVIRSTTDLLRAALAYERDDVPAASRLLLGSFDEGLRHSIVESSLFGWETAMQIAAIEQGNAAALAIARRAETLMALRHGERARRMIKLAHARILLRATAGHDAPALAVELRSLIEDETAQHMPPSFRQAAHLVLARFLVRYGNPRDAIALVQPVRNSAGTRGEVALWAEATIIYGGALARLDDYSRGSRLIWDAICRLAEQGFRRSIIDEAVLLAPIVDRLTHRASERPDHPVGGVIATLAAACGKSIPDTPAEAESMGTIRPSLTENERRVLRLVAAGLTNADIAGKMGVQLTTVKFHLSNIFAKFDVHSRTAAIAVANRLRMDL